MHRFDQRDLNEIEIHYKISGDQKRFLKKKKKGEAVFNIYEALEKSNCPSCHAVEIRNVL